MKKFSIFFLMPMIVLALFGACKGDDGEDGLDGADGTNGTNGTNGETGTANVMYSNWFAPAVWSGVSGAYYFEVIETAITQAIIDNGVVLAYTDLSADATNIRPLPANTGTGGSTIWNYLIPAVGTIRFTVNTTGVPSLSNYFRYVIIPGGNTLKATTLSVDVLSKMPYSDVCIMLGIPE